MHGEEDTLLDESALRAAGCWENVDRVPGDEAATAFKRRARWLQAAWRERQGVPIGSHP